MLPKKQRISVEMFKRVGMGKTYHNPLFSIRQNRIDEPHSRFAVVVSSKVAKTAVKRNQIRRRIYEIIKKFEKKIPSPFAYIVFVKKEGVNATFKDLEKSVASTLFLE